MSFELPEIKIVLRASLVLTLITMVGYYFPDLTISGFIVYVCTSKPIIFPLLNDINKCYFYHSSITS